MQHRWNLTPPKTLHVVAEVIRPDNKEDNIYTVSPNPNEPGWNTDSSYPGYGLPKFVAEEIVRRWNLVQE